VFAAAVFGWVFLSPLHDSLASKRSQRQNKASVAVLRPRLQISEPIRNPSGRSPDPPVSVSKYTPVFHFESFLPILLCYHYSLSLYSVLYRLTLESVVIVPRAHNDTRGPTRRLEGVYDVGDRRLGDSVSLVGGRGIR